MITDKKQESRCGLRRAVKRVRASEAARHLRNAEREVLLAARSVIDAGLKRLDQCRMNDSDAPARKIEIN